MNDRYAFHPQELAVHETERLYEKMAARGWSLVKRGALLSRFKRAQPEEATYRILTVIPEAEEERPFSEAQLDEYKRTGWEYVTGRGYIHVFRSDKKGDVSGLVLLPGQQEKTLKKLRKRSLDSILQLPVSVLLFLLLGAIISSSAGIRHFTASIYLGWIEDTAGIAGLVLLILWLQIRELCSIWYLKRLRIRVRNGVEDESSSKPWDVCFILFNRLLFLAALIFGILAAVQWAGGYNHEMPLESDGPYLVLADVGVTGERTQSFIKNGTSMAAYEESLLSEHWKTFEVVDADGREVWMRQDVYRLKHTGMAARLAEVLMKDSVFADSPEDFTEVDIPGLDHAWVSERMECIAVKGDNICFVTYPADGREALLLILQAMADKWA